MENILSGACTSTVDRLSALREQCQDTSAKTFGLSTASECIVAAGLISIRQRSRRASAGSRRGVERPNGQFHRVNFESLDSRTNPHQNRSMIAVSLVQAYCVYSRNVTVEPPSCLRKAWFISLLLFCVLCGTAESQTVVSDPVGDTFDQYFTFKNDPAPDILSVTGGYSATDVVFLVEFVPGTFDPMDYRFDLYLDTNETTENRGAGPAGADYWMRFRLFDVIGTSINPVGNTDFKVYPYPELIGGGAETGSATVALVSPDAVRIEIPLSALGNDDGVMRYAVLFYKSQFPVKVDEFGEIPFNPFLIDVAPNSIMPNIPNDNTFGALDSLFTTPGLPAGTPALPPAELYAVTTAGTQRSQGPYESETTVASIGPPLITNPDNNDVARQKIETMEHASLPNFLAEAKASIQDIGVSSESFYPWIVEPALRWAAFVEAEAVAGFKEHFIVVGPPGQQVGVDLTMHLDGSLGLINLQPQDNLFGVPDTSDLWAEVRLQAIVHKLEGQFLVYEATGHLESEWLGAMSIRDVLTTSGSSAWENSWTRLSIPDRGEHGVVYDETIPSVFLVMTGGEYLLELRLSCETHGGKSAAAWSAFGNFLNSASGAFSTDDPNVTLEIIRPDPTLAITGVEVVGADVTLTWESFPGRRYAIEGKSALSATWETLKTDIEAAPDPNNRTSGIAESFSAVPITRFYRVVELASEK